MATLVHPTQAEGNRPQPQRDGCDAQSGVDKSDQLTRFWRLILYMLNSTGEAASPPGCGKTWDEHDNRRGYECDDHSKAQTSLMSWAQRTRPRISVI